MISKEQLNDFIDVIIDMTSVKPSLWYMYNDNCLVMKYDPEDDAESIYELLKRTYVVGMLRENEIMIKVSN